MSDIGLGLMQGEQFRQGLLQQQAMRDELQTYPDLLQAQLQQQQANSGIAQNTLNYAPQTSQADIASKNAYANLAPYQAAGMIANNPMMWLMLQNGGLPNLNGGGFGSNGSGNSAIPPITSSNGGMTVQPAGNAGAPQNAPMPFSNGGVPYAMNNSSMPSGANNNYPVLPGGNANMTPQQLNTGPQQGGLGTPVNYSGNSPFQNLVNLQLNRMMQMAGKDPRFGSQRSGAGGTYTDPATGQQVSTDTSKNTSLDQQTIASIQRVQPLLNQLSKLSQFQSLPGEVGLRGAQVSNYVLGTQFPQTEDYALGNQALQLAPEGLMRAWGLNVTDDSKKTMQDAVKPIFGETQAQYNNRLITTMKTLQGIVGMASDRLSKGQAVGNVNANQSSQSMNFDIPSFNNKDDFQSWYKGLTQPEQGYVRQKLGGT